MKDIRLPKEQDTWIPLNECRDGFLYIINARNSDVGIFKQAKSAFTINRLKFGRRFLFDEYHWDIGEPCGTVKPLAETGPAGTFETDEELLEYLAAKRVELREEIVMHIGGFYEY